MNSLTSIRSRAIFFFIGIALLFSSSCKDDDGSSKEAVKKLTEDVITQAPAAESAKNFLSFIKALDQAKGLDSTAQCKAGRDIYCELYRMVKENCDGSETLCSIIEKNLYGGSFPAGGMRLCMVLADEKCGELTGSKQELKRICDEFRSLNCN
ncbi:MAG: hypothetical protein KTR13_07760 [Saprospiraceae bacterium]|nr:hypothetical protein [Saprospiraceae bacterium]